MAESFKNFCNGTIVTNHNEIIIIPSGVSNNEQQITYPVTISNGYNVRNIGDYAQIHSIYITLKCDRRIEGVDRYNPANFGAFDLYIKRTDNSNYKLYLVHDGRVVPGAPFFIEKNITLEPQQYLVLSCPNDAKDYDMDQKTSVTLNTNPKYHIEVSASAILLPGSN